MGVLGHAGMQHTVQQNYIANWCWVCFAAVYCPCAGPTHELLGRLVALNVEQLAYASELFNYPLWEQQLHLERRQLQLQELKQMVALAGEQYLTDVYNDVSSRHLELVRQHQADITLARSHQQQQQQVPQPVHQQPQQQHAVLILQQQQAALVHQQQRAALLQQHLLQQQLQACLLLQQQQPQVQQQPQRCLPMMQVQSLDRHRERHAAAMRQRRAVQSAEAAAAAAAFNAAAEGGAVCRGSSCCGCSQCCRHAVE
jgi:hypothetical protein